MLGNYQLYSVECQVGCVYIKFVWQLVICITYGVDHIEGLVQDCSNSSALAMQLLQYFTKPLIWYSLKWPIQQYTIFWRSGCYKDDTCFKHDMCYKDDTWYKDDMCYTNIGGIEDCQHAQFDDFPVCAKQHTAPIMATQVTSLNGNIFRITGPLCGEFTSCRWIPRMKASDAEVWYILWFAPVE